MSIKNGRYRLRNQASDTYFDVPAKGGNAGKAHGWHGMANNLNQEWDIEQVGGKYRIKNAGTGKWVDAENGGRDNGRVITSDHARQWELKEDGGAIAIIIPETGTAIDLDFGHSTDGASISVWRFMSNKRYQHWVFEMVLIDLSQLELHEPILKSVEYLISNGRYHIKNYASNTYLDVPAQGPNAGKAHGWAGSSDNANQQWVVEMSLGKYYTIKNYRTGKWLNVEKIDGGGRVITSDHPRLWEIRHNGVGTAILIPDNHAAIDLHNGQKNNGAPISVWKIDYGKDHQRWMFEPVKTTPWRH